MSGSIGSHFVTRDEEKECKHDCYIQEGMIVLSYTKYPLSKNEKNVFFESGSYNIFKIVKICRF